MPLPSPRLDDRSFEQLLEDARRRVAESDSDWTDLSPSDPGAVLLEVFAYLTELMLYRLNRLPDKVYVELLRLIGVKLAPPAAAMVRLRFAIARAQSAPVAIPAGTRVTLARAAGAVPPVFTTLQPAAIAPGDLSVEVAALHASQVDGELLGMGTGLPQQALRVAHAPLIAPTGDGLDLVVGVEVGSEDRGERMPALDFQGKAYRIWSEVANFTEAAPDSRVYLVDRASGLVTFAPRLQRVDPQGVLADPPVTLAAVPAAGREIRAWYRWGGGEAGNVGAGMLTSLKDPIPGVQVGNPAPATGGGAAETLDNALLRGPEEIHSLRRAVTAHSPRRSCGAMRAPARWRCCWCPSWAPSSSAAAAWSPPMRCVPCTPRTCAPASRRRCRTAPR